MVLILLSSVSPNLPTPTSLSPLSPRSPCSASSPSAFFAILSPIFTADDAPASPSSVNASATPSPRILSPGNIPPVTPPPWLIGARSPTSPLRPAPLRLASESRIEKRLPSLPGMLSTPISTSTSGMITGVFGRPPPLRNGSFGADSGTPRSLFSRDRGGNPPSARLLGAQPQTRPGPRGGFKRTRTEPLSSMNLQVHQQQQQALPSLPSPSLETSVAPSNKPADPSAPPARPAPPARAHTYAAASVPRLAINGIPSHESHPSENADEDEDMESPTTPKASSMLPSPEQEEARRLSMAVMGVDVDHSAGSCGFFSASARPKSPSTPKPEPELPAAAPKEPEVMEVPLAIDTRPSRTPSPAATSFAASPSRAGRSESLLPAAPAPAPSSSSRRSSPSSPPSPRSREDEYAERRAKRRSVLGLEGLAVSSPGSSLGSPASLGSARSVGSGGSGSSKPGPLGRLARAVGR